jgi:hypothetical protein
VASVARHAVVLKMKFNMCSVDEIWTLGTFRSENLRSSPLVRQKYLLTKFTEENVIIANVNLHIFPFLYARL